MDMGLSLRELHPDPLPGTLPPGVLENPVVAETGDPGGRPSKLSSCSVMDEAQPPVLGWGHIYSKHGKIKRRYGGQSW